MISRHFDLKAVHEHLSVVPDIDRWRIPSDHIRPTQNWSVEWGQEEDAKLAVGIWKHGFGSWEAIQADPSLGLTGKFFLEDQKTKPLEEGQTKSTPTAVHLVRRGDYVCGLIREWEDNARYYAEQQTAAPSGSSHPAPPDAPSSKRKASAKAQSASAAAAAAQAKRKATPTYTDTESDGSD